MSSTATELRTPPPTALDAFLGRFTMYRLVFLVLAVLAAYSLVLDILGWLTFGIGNLAAHLALCLGLTYASNRALAAVFRVRPHSESSLITGLLLYFLFWPTQPGPAFAPADLAGVALACVLASASKYVLAWRGRHVFNPAAAGAFLTGLTGLNIATWWAGTPAMLWLLVPGVLAVVYRTRKLLMASVFTAVATSIAAGTTFLVPGADLAAAVWQPLAQSPALFFAGFMLTEPLTLPPRRWQQLVLAAVVGALFATPFNFGIVANSPELALLSGNLLAFLAGQRGSVRLRFSHSRRLTPTATEFIFRPRRPLRHEPGQYVELDLPHKKSDGKGRRRVFSLTNSPDGEHVKLGVGTASPVSAAKRQLLALKPGEELTATTVAGDFVLPKGSHEPVLLIAAGIGITPYLAHLASGLSDQRDTVLIYLARNAAELAYADELENSGARIIARLADGSAPPEFMEDARTRLERGARLDGHSLKLLVPDIAGRSVLISGSPASVGSLKRAARQAGARRIQVDSFAGY